jgi:hypothetical protein
LRAPQPRLALMRGGVCASQVETSEEVVLVLPGALDQPLHNSALEFCERTMVAGLEVGLWSGDWADK